MTNELLFFASVIVYFCLVLSVYRFFGLFGLFTWIGFSTVIANIEVVKTVELFGLTSTLGNVMYGTIFLCTDIIHEKYSIKTAKKAVYLGFFTLLSMLIIMQIVLQFTPHETDFTQESLQTIFGLMPSVVLGSLTAYLVSQTVDVKLFGYLKKKFPSNKYLWLRNTGSTAISQLLDSLVFTVIAFYATYGAEVWFEIFLTTYILKFVVAILDTPFMYWAKKIKPKEITFQEPGTN